MHLYFGEVEILAAIKNMDSAITRLLKQQNLRGHMEQLVFQII
jgi:hypothetical protein